MMADATRASPSPRRPRCCAGVAEDLRSLRARYASDWREGGGLLGGGAAQRADAWRALAAGVFAFFAQAAPAIAFAGFLSERTRGECGVAEALLGMGASGLLFALCAGQPLVLVGTTGPVCVFVAALADIAAAQGLPFRGALFWTCVWAATMHAALAAAGAPRAFVRAVTPFSGEVFGALVGAVYVFEGASALAALGGGGGGRGGGGSGAGALSVGLGAGCALLALALTRARDWWKCCPRRTSTAPTLAPAPTVGAAAASGPPHALVLRAAAGVIADYGLALAVASASALQFVPAFFGARAALPLLQVPARFAPTQEARPWLDAAAIAGLPPWAAAAAAGPGAVLTALLYFDHQISAMLSQEPRFGLRKPPSYDLDFLILGASLLLTATLGLPPVYGLLPQAPLHVEALARQPHAGGGGASGAASVVETRWSALLQSALLLALLAPGPLALLAALPQGVLAGMLVFLGLAGLAGNGVVRRVGALLLARGPRPAAAATEGAGLPSAAPSRRAELTLAALQVVLVAATFAITRSAAALAFPLAILLLVPLRRFALPRLFGRELIDALDPPDWGLASATAAAAQAAADEAKEAGRVSLSAEEPGAPLGPSL